MIDDYSRDLRKAKWGSGVSLHGSNPEPLMSGLGQKQTSRHLQPMSALPPKADIGTWPSSPVLCLRYRTDSDARGLRLLDHIGGAFSALERQHQVRLVPLQHFLVALLPGPAAELVPVGPASHPIYAARLSPHPRPIVRAIIISRHRIPAPLAPTGDRALGVQLIQMAPEELHVLEIAAAADQHPHCRYPNTGSHPDLPLHIIHCGLCLPLTPIADIGGARAADRSRKSIFTSIAEA